VRGSGHGTTIASHQVGRARHPDSQVFFADLPKTCSAPYLCGRMGAAIADARSGERAMILIELMFGLAVAVFLLLVLPVVLLMAGIAGVVLLWLVAPAALLGVLALWLIFPAFHSTAAVLLLIAIAFFLLERRSHYRAYRRP
jgi:hypothetical protein